MRTWHYEVIFVGLVLCGVTYFCADNLINWITTAAVWVTFNHAQIADRMQERQKMMDKPTVECYHKLNKLFIGKEILWIVAFLLMKNYAALVGCAMFALYPVWRKFYRKYRPIDRKKVTGNGN
jgi:hypothetical protein